MQNAIFFICIIIPLFYVTMYGILSASDFFHKPTVEYTEYNRNVAIVTLFTLTHTGGFYSSYAFLKKGNCWVYKMSERIFRALAFLFVSLSIILVIYVGVLTGNFLYFLIMELALFEMIFFPLGTNPLRAYFVLKKYMREHHYE